MKVRWPRGPFQRHETYAVMILIVLVMLLVLYILPPDLVNRVFVQADAGAPASAAP